MSGLIAIVGRPNVGKSALFNRIARKRIAIVHDEPGVTRDRISVAAEWHGRKFTLVDTGGIGLTAREKALDVITKAALEQVDLAIEAASAIILVVNVQEGLVPLDKEVADRLRKSQKPVLVAVNKVDSYRAEGGATEFSSLGFERMFNVSAIHGLGLDEIIAAAMEFLPKDDVTMAPAEGEEGQEPAAEGEAAEGEEVVAGPKENEPLKLAFVGRPNVGKSSLVNALTRSERVIVSPIPGTTRDSVDVPFEVETEGHRENYILIDTAGVRQERRIDNSIEFFSVRRTEDSIARSDITILVLDAESGVTAHDKKVAGKIFDERKACILIVNKWDLLGDTILEARKEEIKRRGTKESQNRDSRQMTTLSEFGQWVQEHLFFLDYAPVIFTSAKSGFHLERLLEAIRYVASQLKQKIPTSLLNKTLNLAIEKRQPVSSGGHRLKFFYATQVKTSPPTFVLFVNRTDLFTDVYAKYLSRELRAAFGFEGCPIQLIPRARPKTVESVRKFKPNARTVVRANLHARSRKEPRKRRS